MRQPCRLDALRNVDIATQGLNLSLVDPLERLDKLGVQIDEPISWEQASYGALQVIVVIFTFVCQKRWRPEAVVQAHWFARQEIVINLSLDIASTPSTNLEVVLEEHLDYAHHHANNVAINQAYAVVIGFI